MKLGAIALMVIALGGCQSTPAQNGMAVAQDAYTKTLALQDQVEALRKRVADIEKDAEGDSDYLTLGEDGFSVVKTELGGFTVEWINASPDGSGTKIGLRVGNVTAAKVTSLTAIGIWRRKDPDGNIKKSGTFSVRRKKISCAAGTWCEFSFHINDVKPEEISEISVGYLNADSLTLTTA